MTMELSEETRDLIRGKARELHGRFHEETDPSEREIVESLTLTARRMMEDDRPEQAIHAMIQDTNIGAIEQALMFY